MHDEKDYFGLQFVDPLLKGGKGKAITVHPFHFTIAHHYLCYDYHNPFKRGCPFILTAESELGLFSNTRSSPFHGSALFVAMLIVFQRWVDDNELVFKQAGKNHGLLLRFAVKFYVSHPNR